MTSSSTEQPQAIVSSSSPNSKPHWCKPKPHWLEQSVLRRLHSPFKRAVTQKRQASPVLRQQQQQHTADDNHDSPALFRRDELLTGRRIGAGGFSEVRAVVGIRLCPDVSAKCTDRQQRARLRHASAFDDTNNKTGAHPQPPRLAIKYLKKSLLRTPLDFLTAAVDLALEADYMSAFGTHPNILSVRGTPVDGLNAFRNRTQHDSYFLLLDRLDHTLGTVIHEDWKLQLQTAPSVEQKVQWSLQLAQALEYLHRHNIVYRDLKPQNIGVLNGTLQLFDFGLCRELPSSSNTSSNCSDRGDIVLTSSTTPIINDVYQMSDVGTRRYMAGEVRNGLPYNQKVDVYGWAIVTWEMLTVTKPYANYSVDEHNVDVCQNGDRPWICPSWPVYVQTALRQGWTASVEDRWDAARIVSHLSTHAMLVASMTRGGGGSCLQRRRITIPMPHRQPPQIQQHHCSRKIARPPQSPVTVQGLWDETKNNNSISSATAMGHNYHSNFTSLAHYPPALLPPVLRKLQSQQQMIRRTEGRHASTRSSSSDNNSTSTSGTFQYARQMLGTVFCAGDTVIDYCGSSQPQDTFPLRQQEEA